MLRRHQAAQQSIVMPCERLPDHAVERCSRRPARAARHGRARWCRALAWNVRPQPSRRVVMCGLRGVDARRDVAPHASISIKGCQSHRCHGRPSILQPTGRPAHTRRRSRRRSRRFLDDSSAGDGGLLGRRQCHCGRVRRRGRRWRNCSHLGRRSHLDRRSWRPPCFHSVAQRVHTHVMLRASAHDGEDSHRRRRWLA